jgi:hypothetical protein
LYQQKQFDLNQEVSVFLAKQNKNAKILAASAIFKT